MTTIAIDSNLYSGAEKYAKAHNISVRELVENFLKSIQRPVVNRVQVKEATLPKKWEALCGILSDVQDTTDERFNYIINK